MKFIQPLNLALAFLLEIALLAAYCYGGFHFPISQLLRSIVGIGIPVIVIIFWSFFLAPRATHRLALPWLLLCKMLLFSGAVLILFIVQQKDFAILLGIITLLNLGLAILFGQA